MLAQWQEWVLPGVWSLSCQRAYVIELRARRWPEHPGLQGEWEWQKKDRGRLKSVTWVSRTASPAEGGGQQRAPSGGIKQGEQGGSHLQSRLRRPGRVMHLDLWSGRISTVRHREAKWVSPSCSTQSLARARTQVWLPTSPSRGRRSGFVAGGADGELPCRGVPGQLEGVSGGVLLSSGCLLHVSLSSLPQMNLEESCTVSRPWFPHLGTIFKIPFAPVEWRWDPSPSLIPCSLGRAFGWRPGARLSPVTS